MKSVELHPAHVWDCDACGRENFERCIAFEPDDDQMEDGIEQGEWVTAPEDVTCKHCGTTFKVELPSD